MRGERVRNFSPFSRLLCSRSINPLRRILFKMPWKHRSKEKHLGSLGGLIGISKTWLQSLPAVYCWIWSSGSFWHGRTGQPPGAAFFHDTGGRHKHLKKIIIICAAKRFSIIYHITVWGIGKLAPLLAVWEGAVHRSCVRSGKGRGARPRGTVDLYQMEWTRRGGGIHLVG